MKNSKLFISAVAAMAAVASAVAPATASAEATTTTVWEETSGNGDLGSWGKILEIPGKNFKNAMAGDVVKFTFAEQGENPQIQIAAQAGPGWKWTTVLVGGVDYIDTPDATYEWTIPASYNSDDFNIAANDLADYADWVPADDIVTNGLKIKGQNQHIAKIELISNSSNEEEAGAAIWTGSEALTSFSNTVEVPKSAFANLKAGNTLRLRFTDCGNTPQLQLAVKDKNWIWTSFVDAANIMREKYEFVVTDDPCKLAETGESILRMLQTHGLYVKGKDATLVSIEIVGGDAPVNPDQPGGDVTENSVWTGDEDLNGWNNLIEIPASAFAAAKEGDTMLLSFSDCGETPQVQLAVKTVAAGDWTQIVDYDDIIANKYEYKIEGTPDGVDDTLLAMLQANGLFVKGQQAHLIGVSILSKGGDTPVNPDQPDKPGETKENTIWEGDEDLNGWNNLIEIPASAFAAAKEGDTMLLSFSDCGETPQVQLAVKTINGGDWTQIVDYDAITANKYEYKIAGEAGDGTLLQLLQANGLFVKGQQAHLKGVVLIQKTTSAVETIEEIDLNAPMEIYTLDGRRVNEMEKGLYILRQGNKVMKVIK